jgi:hypothetical protein
LAWVASGEKTARQTNRRAGGESGNIGIDYQRTQKLDLPLLARMLVISPGTLEFQLIFNALHHQREAASDTSRCDRS